MVETTRNLHTITQCTQHEKKRLVFVACEEPPQKICDFSRLVISTTVATYDVYMVKLFSRVSHIGGPVPFKETFACFLVEPRLQPFVKGPCLALQVFGFLEGGFNVDFVD